MKIPLRRYWNLLVRYLRPQRRRFWLLAALLLSGIGLQVAIPQITRVFIDHAQGDGPERLLLIAATAFIGLAILQQVLTLAASYVGAVLAWTATNGLREDLAAHCLRLDMGYHNDISPGELIERIDGDVSVLAQFFSQLVIQVVGNLLLLAGILIALTVVDWRIGAAYTVFAVLALALINALRELAIPFEKARRQANADLFAFIEERLAGTEDLRSSGAEAYVIDRLYGLQHAIHGCWRDVALRNLAIGSSAHLVTMVGYALAAGMGWWLHGQGVISIGTVYLMVHYTNLIARPFRELTQQVENLQGAGASIERLEGLLDVMPAIEDGPGATLPDGPMGLAFDGVTFAYDEDPVLHDIQFALEPGRVLGLLGRTGSGKSTLSRLVFRLYEAQSGAVRVGGVDVDQPALGVLRRRVAMVTQEVQLFRANLRDNVTLFDRSIDDDRIREVLEALELGPWLAQLPAGLDTEIESGSRNLSAGQSQLLAFARVFLRDPGLLILDEASSRLDPATEAQIERALDQLLVGRTCVLIAHRLDTVQRADEIMILEEGRIVEHGPRAPLAADPDSRFAGLLRTGMAEALA